MAEKFSLLYITASSKKEARFIGRVLVQKRLCACVNILDKMESHYWWKGELETGHETVLIAKTRNRLVKKAIREVTSLHSYECPCIVALPITDGYPGFLDWIKAETRG
ncbi:MAG: divalent-cation tolerance protein CutA [Fibrobacterota bacterium]